MDMSMIPEAVGAVSLAIWTHLVLARGEFWRLRDTDLPSPEQTAPAQSIAVIIPARNEADVVGHAVRSLLEQNYAGRLHIFLVDDESSDNTATVARQAAEHAGGNSQLTVVRARPVPDGWTGKMWALSEGLHEAVAFDADYFLLTDADIVHAPDNVASLVARAQSGGFDLVSLMAKLQCQSLAEQALIPAFVFFFFMLYPPAWVGRPRRRTAAAAGGCLLIRSEALARIGGIGKIRGEVIDDCALARAVKQGGNRIWLGLARDTYSLRGHGTWAENGQMISRTAFAQLRHSIILLLGTVAAMAITYLAPPILLGMGSPAAAMGLAAWLLMAIAFWPTLRYYRRSPLWALLLPLIAAFYLGATIYSAVRYWKGSGGLWKGRVQDPVRAPSPTSRAHPEILAIPSETKLPPI
jgi:hopene-associated glycosyltransferase HpnB